MHTDKLQVVRSGTEILHQIDLSIAPARITGLLGPSGCGKTTLMRAIIGTQTIAGGTVTVLGRPAGHPQLRREVGYASQAASVYDDLTVAENLRYFAARAAARRGRCRAGRSSTSTWPSTRDRIIGALSGGQRSRVSLAVAMLGSRELLVLDEPTVGLDPVLRADLWRLFHDLAADGHDAAGLQPRHGRGRPLRWPAADARRPAARRGHPGRAAARTGTTTWTRRSCA